RHMYHGIRPVFTAELVADVSLRARLCDRVLDRDHQHSPAKARYGSNAWPRDEHVSALVHGDDADRKPPRGHGLEPLRPAAHTRFWRICRHRRRDDRTDFQSTAQGTALSR